MTERDTSGTVVSFETAEALRRHYPVLVIDPYAENIKDMGPNAGDVRLSFYSAFVLHTARELIEHGIVDHVIVFDDASFGPRYPSTGDLTYDYLTRDRIHQDEHMGPIIDPSKVTPYKGKNLARTPTQIEKVLEYMEENGLKSEEALYLGWDYHRERVENHARGFGVKIRFVSAPQVHKIYRPNFDLDKLMEVLPMDEIEEMEAGGPLGGVLSRRGISRWDPLGVIPRVTQPLMGGPHMLDNRRGANGRLRFDYRPGKDRLRELGMPAKP